MTQKTPVSALQELMAARSLPLPIYAEEGFGTSFKCTVHAAGITAAGISTTKKGAKHESAKNALQKLVSKTQQIILIPVPSSTFPEKSLKNYVGELNEFASQHSLPYPSYDYLTIALNGEFLCKCSFVKKEVLGSSANKKLAKQVAARRMLDLLQTMGPGELVDGHTIFQGRTNFVIPDKEKIISLYKALSVNDPLDKVLTITDPLAKNDDISSTISETDVITDIPDNVDVLKAKLHQRGIEYSLQELQRLPFIVHVRIKNTKLDFIGIDKDREEATRKVLQDVLDASKCCSLTNDLISFS